jgi:hypothetical protein
VNDGACALLPPVNGFLAMIAAERPTARRDQDFIFPEVPVELRPLLLQVLDVVRDELRQAGHRATIVENTVRNRIRHAFEATDLADQRSDRHRADLRD